MSERKINLEELYSKGKGSNVNISKTQFKKTVLEFGKQLLKLAYENAKIKEHRPDWEDDRRYYEVSEKSILDTIKQVE